MYRIIIDGSMFVCCLFVCLFVCLFFTKIAIGQNPTWDLEVFKHLHDIICTYNIVYVDHM